MKTIFLLLHFATISSSALAATPLEPGEYEYKIAITTKGLPAAAAAHMPKGNSNKICLRAEDLQKKIPLQKIVEQPSCKVQFTKQTDARMEWTLSCSGGMTTGSGWLDVKKNAFNGESKTTTVIPGAAAMIFLTKYDGKRSGVCH